LRCLNAPQFLEQRGSRPRIGMSVVEQLVRPVRAHGDGVNLKRQPGGVHFGVHMAGFLPFVHRASDHANPFVHDGGDAISHHSAPAIEFKRRGAEKAPPFEHVPLHQLEPEVDDLPQPRHALAGGNRRPGNLFDKHLSRFFDRR